MYPVLKVDTSALFVATKAVRTAAGVSTGIDMALALGEADLYRRTPSNCCAATCASSSRRGHQSQFSDILDAQAGPYAELTDRISANLEKDLSAQALAIRSRQSTRTFHCRFTDAVG
jgi:transcriptional regulator GlxA family with amidase domain